MVPGIYERAALKEYIPLALHVNFDMYQISKLEISTVLHLRLKHLTFF